MKNGSQEMHIAELLPQLKALEYQLQENGNTFTIQSDFSYRSDTLRPAYALMGIGLTIFYFTFFHSEGPENLWWGIGAGVFFLTIGIYIIWVEKSHYFKLGLDEIRYKDASKTRVIPLRSGMEVAVDKEVFTKSGKGGVRTIQNTNLTLGKGKGKQIVFSISIELSRSDPAEELINGLALIVKQRIDQLERQYNG